MASSIAARALSAAERSTGKTNSLRRIVTSLRWSVPLYIRADGRFSQDPASANDMGGGSMIGGPQPFAYEVESDVESDQAGITTLRLRGELDTASSATSAAVPGGRRRSPWRDRIELRAGP